MFIGENFFYKIGDDLRLTFYFLVYLCAIVFFLLKVAEKGEGGCLLGLVNIGLILINGYMLCLIYAFQDFGTSGWL